MTRLAVVAYPEVEPDDGAWIESTRARHDPQASRIKAHFTLVFPAEVPHQALVAEVHGALAHARPIPFVLRRAAAVREAGGGGGHVFLLPDPGHAELLALHDRLYQGVLRPHLRVDLPFLPHLTVGASADFTECQRVAQALSRERRPVAGTVRGVEIIEVGAGTIRTLVAVPMAGDG